MTTEELQAKILELQDELKNKNLDYEKISNEHNTLKDELKSTKETNSKLLEKNQDLFLRLTTPTNPTNTDNNSNDKTHTNIEIQPLHDLIEKINK